MKKGRKARKITLDGEVITRNEVKQILENTVGNNHKQKRELPGNDTQVTVTAECVEKINTSENQSNNLINKNQGHEEVIKNEESRRSLKRKRHALLLKEKQLKSVLTNQQRSLNYLSLWKHHKSKWKFEKLRQVWLQQNMYDISKVPDNFFIILLEYFTQSKGKVKDAIVEKAVSIVEEEQLANADSCDKMKLIRARTVVQNLGV
ncbi:uncharacterized protein C7orf50 homolog [Agrilus planipennis]|uniref:Uncharacterized protein C7orf50 homolog n=1 Tax=Agrilus planipennis TaxID=224129 RepID=A0A7F5RHE6_AGRPL|nr:uncharacterized protein C7orf50 homolog [Agrilus planipennis]